MDRAGRREWEEAGGVDWERERERIGRKREREREIDRLFDHAEVRNGMLEWKATTAMF